MSTIDVAIVGAGLAGLVAALQLQRAGRSVRVFEARRRTGGRAYSPAVAGHPVDLGATWVWDSERHIHGLLRELEIETFAHFDEGLDVYDSGTLQRGRFPRSSIPERRVHGGVQAITHALAERVDSVELGAAVRAIEPGDGGLMVHTEREAVAAEAVLVALPPSLLAHSIELPALESKAMWARVPVWMGDIAKVVAVFEHRFWAEQGLSGRAASAVGPMVEIHDMSGPEGTPACLFGFVPQSAGSHDLAARVREQLLHLFGPQATPQQLMIQRWWDEPRTTSGPLNEDPGLLGHADLRQPAMGGRLHLISCETSGISPGHLNGAVERAHAAVARLLQP